MGIDADFLRRQQQASVIRLGGQHAEPGHDGAQRRRYATRDELDPLPAARALAGRVLDALANQGVDVAALVKITVEED
jgi:hypothetical protein